MVKNILRRTVFHRFSCIHDHNMVCHLCHHAHIMGDQEHRGIGFFRQSLDDPQDLGLDRHIQSRRRLICDQQLGVAEQCHGDHHTLTHPSRKLVGKFLDPLLRRRDPHPLQHLHALIQRILF